MNHQQKRGVEFAVVLVCLLQVSWTRPDNVLASNCISLGCDNKDGYTVERNSSHSEIQSLKMGVEDIGNWTCSTSSGGSGCSVKAYKNPSCNITQVNDKVALNDQLLLWVNIADGYCSGQSSFTLQVGDVTEELFTTAENISTKGVSLTLNMTAKHYGPLELTFLCHKKRNNLRCTGLKEIVNKTHTNDPSTTNERETANSAALALTPINITAAAGGVILLILLISIPASRCCTKVEKQTIKQLDPPYVSLDCPTGCEYASVVDLGGPSRPASLNKQAPTPAQSPQEETSSVTPNKPGDDSWADASASAEVTVTWITLEDEAVQVKDMYGSENTHGAITRL